MRRARVRMVQPKVQPPPRWWTRSPYLTRTRFLELRRRVLASDWLAWADAGAVPERPACRLRVAYRAAYAAAWAECIEHQAAWTLA